jgi:hypothetical protein
MTRADKIARRQADRIRWLQVHAAACIICGAIPQAGEGEYYAPDPNGLAVMTCDEHISGDQKPVAEAARALGVEW